MSLCGSRPLSVTEGSTPGARNSQLPSDSRGVVTKHTWAGRKPGRQRSAQERRCPALPLLTRTPAPQALRSVLKAWRHRVCLRHRPGGVHGPPGGAQGPAQAGCAAAALRALPVPAARLSSTGQARVPAHPNTAQGMATGDTRVPLPDFEQVGWGGGGSESETGPPGPVRGLGRGRITLRGCVRCLLLWRGLRSPRPRGSPLQIRVRPPCKAPDSQNQGAGRLCGAELLTQTRRARGTNAPVHGLGRRGGGQTAACSPPPNPV